MEEYILPMSTQDCLFINLICSERIAELGYLTSVTANDEELAAAHRIRRGVYETRRLIVAPPGGDRRPMSDHEVRLLALWADNGHKIRSPHPDERLAEFTNKFNPKLLPEVKGRISEYADLSERLLEMREVIIASKVEAPA